MNSPMSPGLAALFGGPSSASTPDRRGIPEAQVERLREVQHRYVQPNPFEPGDLVTPRPDAGMNHAGDILIVLEVMPRVWPPFNVSPYGSDKRFDMRVAYVSREGRILSCWAESFELEPWAPASATSADNVPRSLAPDEAPIGAAA